MTDRGFQIGDVVALKCGGPGMVVSYAVEDDGVAVVTCMWHKADHAIAVGTFRGELLDLLEAVDAPPMCVCGHSEADHNIDETGFCRATAECPCKVFRDAATTPPET